MKCPKCLYIGFETGDRCKNCGYDFSLLSGPVEPAGADKDVADLFLRQPPARDEHEGVMTLGESWDDPDADRFRDLPEPDSAPHTAPVWTLGSVTDGPSVPAASVPVPEPPRSVFKASVPEPAMALATDEVPALPLFEPDIVDDEPLVRLPAVPRVPLAVRKTPDVPRLRHAPQIPRPRGYDDAVLEFSEEPDLQDDVVATPRVEPVAMPRAHETPLASAAEASDDEAWEHVSPIRPRLVAALIDYGILLGIDATVVYFTLRLTELQFADWRILPLLPLLVFLLSLKVAYFCAFTAAGGQTIGKMATHIRVVMEDDRRLDAGRALRRAVLSMASIATFGGPFIPALVDPARRGVHDRVSGTRVIALSSH